jgi:pilus assembly protein CpaE
VIHITLVAGQDRQLEDMLKGLGMDVTKVTLEAVASNPADVVVLDLRGATGVPATVATMRRKHPETGIVVVTSTLDPALLLEAMRAGVNEVVAEPLDPHELLSVIERIAGDRAHSAPGGVLGFVGAKGGVGTTTIAVNVAIALGAASKPDRTLLVDLHRAGGEAALFSGVEPRFSVLDALENTHRLDQVFFRNLVIQTAPHTDLLASPDRPGMGAFDRERIHRVVSFMASSYKHTVIDLPRSDSPILEALDPLTTIYIVVNQELATVKSASRMAAMLRERYGREKVKVVLSRSDRDADIGEGDVEKAVGCKVAFTFPSQYRVALQALNKGRPVALENHNDLAASFRRFAHRLAGVTPKSEAPRPTGLFGRLTYSR